LRRFFDSRETVFLDGAFFCGGDFLAAKVFGLAAAVAAARGAIGPLPAEIRRLLKRNANLLGNPRGTDKNSIEGQVDGLRTITAAGFAGRFIPAKGKGRSGGVASSGPKKSAAYIWSQRQRPYLA
jgi:hypothetical protein